MSHLRVELLIDNQEIGTDRYAVVRDPGRLNEVVGEYAEGAAEHADRAAQAAHRAFLSWRKTDPGARAELLLKAAEAVDREAAALVPLLSRETGMLPVAFKTEIFLAANQIRAVAERTVSFLEPRLVTDEKTRIAVEKRPLGVVAAIVPWNAPIILTMQKLAPILAMGNTLVVKPSPNAPLAVSVLLRKIAALIPPGVINVVHGGAEAGSALVRHPLVRKISFTGGGATAKRLIRDAADSVKRIHLELGGNDPAIVLDDADLDKAVPKIVEGAFRRSGQICFAVKRLYVPESKYEAVCEQVCALVDRFRVGHALHPDSTMGPVNNRMQFEYVNGLAERTKQAGARVIELGQAVEPEQWNNGYYLLPRVVTHVDPGAEVVVEEQFGPILPILPYRTEEEAIRMANGTEYGLSASIWSSDRERAVAFAKEIEAGMKYINMTNLSLPGMKHVPFGGVKQSGIGRETAEEGLAEFVETQAIDVCMD